MKKNKAKTKGVANKVEQNKVEQEKKYVYLTYTEYREGGGAEDPDDRWSSRTDENIDWNLTGCYLTNKSWPTYTERVEVDFDVQLGDGIWVVYVRYGTGDSFGHTNGAWTIIGVYKNQNEAAKIAEQINLKTYVSPSGYLVWDGYFESFECCEVEGFIVRVLISKLWKEES